MRAVWILTAFKTHLATASVKSSEVLAKFVEKSVRNGCSRPSESQDVPGLFIRIRMSMGSLPWTSYVYYSASGLDKFGR
jgi:hypothetical protein